MLSDILGEKELSAKYTLDREIISNKKENIISKY